MVDENLLTTAKAANIIGVHESSVKRWCNSKKILTQLTQGGHRRILWNDLLSYANEEKIIHPFNIFKENGLNVYLAKEYFLKKDNLEKLSDILFEWIAKVDYKYLVPFINYCYKDLKIPFKNICDKLIFPSLKLVGDKWEDRSLCIADEHRVTQEWIYALSSIRQDILQTMENENSIVTRAIVSCSDENTHEIAALCLRIVLELNDYQVIYLGSRVPANEIAATQLNEKCDLVCISFSPLDSVQSFKDYITTLESRYESKSAYTLVVGGQGIANCQEILEKTNTFKGIDHIQDFSSFENWLKSH